MDKGRHWEFIDTPIIQGDNTTGIYSVAFSDAEHGIIAGGDYLRDTLKTNHVFYTQDGGKTWNFPTTPTRGYRECVEYITRDFVLAVGPTGVDFSSNAGRSWCAYSGDHSIHVVRKARKGDLIILAGNDGKIAIGKLSPPTRGKTKESTKR